MTIKIYCIIADYKIIKKKPSKEKKIFYPKAKDGFRMSIFNY